MSKNILVIKHGSFGDLVLATGAMKAISNFFPQHNLYILTSSKYIGFIKQAPFIHYVLADDRMPLYNFYYNFLIIRKIVNINFDYIFDLQNSKRTSIYNCIFRFLTKSMISSSRPFAHYRYNIPPQGTEHVTTGLNNQIALIGIKEFFKPSINWLKKKAHNYNVKDPYVMIIPGTSKNGLYKRWPPKSYADIAIFLEKKGFNIVVVGTSSDKDSALPILNSCNSALNLLDKSPPEILFQLAKNAKFIISNDSGPALLVSLTNTPLIWIVNNNNISNSNKPVGKKTIKISSKKITDISIEQVRSALYENHLV